MRRLAALVLIGAAFQACSGHSQPVSSPKTLQQAAAATANAKSFTVTVSRVEVTYQAPDRVAQVENGESSGASASSSGGPVSTSGPYSATIIKLFIDGRYYEADGPTGHPGTFTVSARCSDDANVADFVLGMLREMAVSTDIQVVGTGFSFRIPEGAAVPLPIIGIATVVAGFVSYISVNAAHVVPTEYRIGAVNGAPPVTAPSSAIPAERTCGSTNGSGSSPGSGATASTAVGNG